MSTNPSLAQKTKPSRVERNDISPGGETSSAEPDPNRFYLSGLNTNCDPASVDLSPGARLLDRFEIAERRGQGRYGTVYRAADAHRPEEIALKVVPFGPGFNERAAGMLQEELRLHEYITDYSHIVRAHDIHKAPWGGASVMLLSMEYAGGGSFRQWLTDHREDLELRQTQGVEYFGQGCRGVAALHAAGLVHYDLKPENFLLVGGVLKVADLGLSREFYCGAGAMDQRRNPQGTSAYCCPEQLGLFVPGRFDPRADVYSLGAILYEILSPQCRPPAPSDLSHARRRGSAVPPVSLPEYAGPYAALISRCLASDPERRYADAAELLDALENSASSESQTEQLREHSAAPEEKLEWIQIALSRNDANEAMKLCRELLGVLPDHRQANELLDQLQERYDQAAEFYHNIAQSFETRSLDELVELCQEAIALYPEHPAGRLIQTRLVQRARQYRQSMKEGALALGKQQWDNARAFFIQAQQVNPGAIAPLKAARLVERAEREIDEGRRRIDAMIEQGDFAAAREQARHVDQASERLQQSIDSIGANHEDDIE